MTPSKDIFVKFKKCFSINNEEHLLNPLLIHGVGEINLTTENKVYGVPYVSYVPEINNNVLSMKQLILQWFEIEVSDLKCKITHMCDDRKEDKREHEESVKSDTKNVDKGKKPILAEEEIKESAEDKFEINGTLVPIRIKTLDDFTTFMILVNCDRIAYNNKKLFERKFEEALIWFYKIKDDLEIILPPKISDTEICLFDLYKLIVGSGGHEIITIERRWDDIAMSFGFPEWYGEDFSKMFDDYILHPQEFYVFTLKRFGEMPNFENQKLGSETNRIQKQSGCTIDHSVGTSDGGVTRGNGQEDQNATAVQDTVQTRSCKTLNVEESEEKDRSIEGYYSEGLEGTSDGSSGSDDFVIVV